MFCSDIGNMRNGVVMTVGKLKAVLYAVEAALQRSLRSADWAFLERDQGMAISPTMRM